MVLIGVILFASLSFVFMRSARQGGENLTEKQAQVYASEILDYAEKMERGVQRLLRKSCSENEISFENSETAYDYTNLNSPADKHCHVFDQNGASISYLHPNDDWLKMWAGACPPGCPSIFGYWHIDSRMCIPSVGTGTGGVGCRTNGTSSDTELTLILGFIKKEICLQINEMTGVTNPSGEPPSDNNSSYGGAVFKGTFYEGSNIGDSGTGATYLVGKHSGCFRHTNAAFGNPDTYHFYHVLMAR